MQPAYYDNLEEIQNKYWSMLDDAVTNRGSQFRIPVFICAHQDEVDGRIVVLRKSDRENSLLQFHTDLRSPKVQIIKKNPTSGMISKLEDFDYTMEQSEEGYKNFTVIKCKIKSIEWLYLAAKGHRRAKFDLENAKDTWLIP
jgi:pyridoxamine 5'-phosphate oxidase